jgi:hypothetical protein
MFGHLCRTFVVLSLACLAAPASAASKDEAEAARKLGMQHLLDSQLPEGNWDYPGHELGITSLCAIALIENGVAIDDPIIEKAHRWVHEHYLDNRGTYDIALAILFLSRVGDRDNRHAIRDLAARLIAGQNVEGGWSYTCPDVKAAFLAGTGEQPAPPEGFGDNSCTQFAVLGLWVASRWGINIDREMEKVAQRFVRTQNEDGGWAYKVDPEMPQGSRNSMTFAGLFCVTVARANHIRAQQLAEASGKPVRPVPKPAAPAPTPKPAPAPAPDAAPGEEGAAPATPAAPVEVVDPGAEAKTLTEDPVFSKALKLCITYAKGISSGSSRYYLYSIERMGVILGLDKFGDTDWFDKGSTALVATQGKPAGENEAIPGAWQIASTGSSLSDTSFAILFLRKANLGSDITRLLEGEPVQPFQIVSQAAKPRFFKLDDAVKAAQPGDVIRFDGSGPIPIPHVDVDKDLTFEAGFGYSPILTYDLGFDARGIRSDPKKDPTARYLFGVKGATLTLEGFQLRMDPPKTTGVDWSGVAVDSGTLRILNCTISEGARQGFAAVMASGPCRVEVRNSQLTGGRAAIEITPGGAQDVQVDNSVLFSNAGIVVKKGTQPGEKLTLALNRSVVQAPQIFVLPSPATPIDFISNGVAYYGDALGAAFLPSRAGHEGLTWTGIDNLYDLQKWVGFQGTLSTAIKDAKTWNEFWGGTDVNAEARIITFSGKRRHGAFDHEIPPDHYEFASTSQVYGYRKKVGINPLVLGPGYPFAIFREGFDYSAWKSGGAAVASAP